MVGRDLVGLILGDAWCETTATGRELNQDVGDWPPYGLRPEIAAGSTWHLAVYEPLLSPNINVERDALQLIIQPEAPNPL